VSEVSDRGKGATGDRGQRRSGRKEEEKGTEGRGIAVNMRKKKKRRGKRTD
jgi:hypothetical protein